ncbi:MAG: L,D-transpeptidase [Sandaracinaceae bacterium]|nr:L,D-transpeptidase [Sandaracinaceae bacterium]
MRRAVPSSLVLALLAGCAADPSPSSSFDEENGDYFEGHAYDEGRTDAPLDFEKADLASPYSIPEGLPTLARPEIIVSLANTTVHLFDRETGFSRVYPTGVGALGSSGRSITPTGHFATSPDTSDRWWYVPNRWEPAYFEGYPFLRITAENSRGYNTYGLHGPITNPLMRGYVSHGCMRMEKTDLVEVWAMVRSHASTPVTIQQEVELDAAGNEVDVDTEVTLWGPEDTIAYGASVGPRDDRPVGFVGDPCTTAEDCGRFGDPSYFCHEAGFCTLNCQGYCPDRADYASTFCISDPSEIGRGVCVQRVDGRNADCALIPGTAPVDRERFVGTSTAPPATEQVCAAP